MWVDSFAFSGYFGAMNPAKVRRDSLRRFEDLPNVGPAFAEDFRRLGYVAPDEIRGADPVAIFERLGELAGARQDPCVLSVLLSVVEFLDGAEPRPWWEFTAQCRKLLGARESR